jgi:hypothetical protein
LEDTATYFEGRVDALDDTATYFQGLIDPINDTITDFETRIGALEDTATYFEGRVDALDDTATYFNTTLGAKSDTAHTHPQTDIIALSDSLLDRYTKSQANTLLGAKADTSAAALIATPNTFSKVQTFPAIMFNSTDTTGAVEAGRIIFQVSDSTWYGCRSIVANKKWYKLLAP